MESTVWDLVVIGGGAAGFFGALVCAEANPSMRVVILEKSGSVLSKVRVSGGGRCNLTHACFDPQNLVKYYPRGGQELLGAFHRFQPQDTVDWFSSHGVSLKTEPDGRIFPATGQSQTILDCLIGNADSLGIRIIPHCAVDTVRRDNAETHLVLAGGSEMITRKVLLATGGDRSGEKLANGFGHNWIPGVPSLFTFTVKDGRLDGLAGLAVADAQVTLPEVGISQQGPVLVTHWGLSGPAILRLSAWGARYLAERNYRAELVVNWTAGMDFERVKEQVNQTRRESPRSRPLSFNPFPGIPNRLWQRLAASSGLTPEQTWSDVSRNQLSALVGELVQGKYLIQGKGTFKEEFVTCGGIPLNEVDFRSMNSKIYPGLYLAGEILDIDGVTGGFNLQSAWTTGFLAGQAAARDQSFS